MPRILVRCAAGIIAAALAAPAAGAAAAPSIAVASSLRPVMPELVAAFREQGGARVRVSYGASGNLTHQILQGAPFELFLAADTRYVRMLVEAGRTAGAGAVYAYGRIGLFVPGGSPLAPDGRLGDLRARLGDGAVRRFAIPNPAHAPYGVRAREALAHAGLWQAIQPVLVLGENAAQAAQFASSGATDGGIVPASLAATARLQRAGRFAPIPRDWYSPLEQRMVLVRGAGATARRLYEFMRSEPARALLQRGGFAVPGTTR